MANRKYFHVCAYDIVSDRRREAVADVLERKMQRVQYSVFEGRLAKGEADALFAAVTQIVVPGDHVRFYCLPNRAIANCRRFGGANFPEDGDFWLV